MSRDWSKEQLEELKAWAEDPRGRPFWATMEDLAAESDEDIRDCVRRDKVVEAAVYVGHRETLEEMKHWVKMMIERAKENDQKT